MKGKESFQAGLALSHGSLVDSLEDVVLSCTLSPEVTTLKSPVTPDL